MAEHTRFKFIRNARDKKLSILFLANLFNKLFLQQSRVQGFGVINVVVRSLVAFNNLDKIIFFYVLQRQP